MPTGAAATLAANAAARLKREDHKRTKHDSQFSKWKVLIGPNDWEDYSLGKEGVSRYRVENLPTSSSSGLYELAIHRAASSSSSGKLDSDKVLVVYLGEADNVRTRLQQYGRTGAHLGRSDSGQKGCGCFEDIFSRGYSIVYRWAPMENKADAKRTEAQLLNTFDYAWNKGSNGVRRHDDILQKLDKGPYNRTPLTIFSRNLLPFRQKRVGIKIKASKHLSQDNEFSKADTESYNSFWQVFKFNRSQPRLVLDRDGSGSNENDTIICGVALGDDSICRRPPVQGRKRCAEHKGKKTKGYNTVRLTTTEKPQVHSSDDVVFANGEFGIHEAKPPSLGTVPLSTVRESPPIEDCSPICGVAMADGSLCRRQPVSGRKRCDVHKGRKICDSNLGRTRYQPEPPAVSNSHAKVETGVDLQRPDYLNNGGLGSSSICGAPTRNGSHCQRRVKGNGRCWQH